MVNDGVQYINFNRVVFHAIFSKFIIICYATFIAHLVLAHQSQVHTLAKYMSDDVKLDFFLF